MLEGFHPRAGTRQKAKQGRHDRDDQEREGKTQARRGEKQQNAGRRQGERKAHTCAQERRAAGCSEQGRKDPGQEVAKGPFASRSICCLVGTEGRHFEHAEQRQAEQPDHAGQSGHIDRVLELEAPQDVLAERQAQHNDSHRQGQERADNAGAVGDAGSSPLGRGDVLLLDKRVQLHRQHRQYARHDIEENPAGKGQQQHPQEASRSALGGGHVSRPHHHAGPVAGRVVVITQRGEHAGLGSIDLLVGAHPGHRHGHLGAEPLLAYLQLQQTADVFIGGKLLPFHLEALGFEHHRNRSVFSGSYGAIHQHAGELDDGRESRPGSRRADRLDLAFACWRHPNRHFERLLGLDPRHGQGCLDGEVRNRSRMDRVLLREVLHQRRIATRTLCCSARRNNLNGKL